MIDPNLMDDLERLESRCSLKTILDENFGLIKANAAYEVDDNHFSRNLSDARIETYSPSKSNDFGYDFQTYSKYVMFLNVE